MDEIILEDGHLNINQFGFNEFFQVQLQAFEMNDYIAGRISLEHKRYYRVWTDEGELLCEVSGKLDFQAANREDYPAVGDWVVLQRMQGEEKGIIHAILKRKSKFSRKIAGINTEEQIVAANVDTVFLVNSLNDDLNLRRIERYLLLAWESGANPVIILTKVDLCADVEQQLALVKSVAMGVPVIPISVLNEVGMESIATYLKAGDTIALLGSSGVGKSTLTNYLLGYEKQKVHQIREDDAKGRHTTTHRELILLPNGAVMIDTPGMRELQLWDSDKGVSESFADIEGFADNCKFRDCTHHNEPGCAVKEMIAAGLLEEARLISYKKLLKELAYLERRQDLKKQSEERKHWKKISKAARK